MAIINHAFVSAVADGGDATVVRPSSWNADHAISTTFIAPQGRLTLQTGVPVQTSDQTAKSTVYYDSFVGSLCPVWNGTTWDYLTITSDEVPVVLATANVVSGSLYDIFALNVTGALALAIGPAWSTATSRGSGAGTTELQFKHGIRTNKNSLTHAYGGGAGTTDYGPISANRATLLGTLYATANGQTGVALTPAAASGGSNTIVGLFNAYNGIPAVARSCETGGGANWSYNSTTWRSVNNNNNNRITFVDGVQSVPHVGVHHSSVGGSSALYGIIGMNLDSTTAAPNVSVIVGGGASQFSSAIAQENFNPQIGLHYVQAMEAIAGSGTVNFAGSGTSPTRQPQYLELSVLI